MEVQPYQTRTDKLYMSLQRGDEEMSEKKPLQYRLFDGMIGYIDPKEWDVPPCLSSFNQGETLWIELPRTKANKTFLNKAIKPYTHGIYIDKNEMTTNKFRRTIHFIDIKDIADLPEVKKVEPDLMLKVRTHKKKIPVLKIKEIPSNFIKNSVDINMLRDPITETGQITTGLYTVGPAAGDNYPTYGGVGGFVAAIGANQTGTLTGRNTGPITEAALIVTTHNQVGNIFQIDSDTDYLGNYNNGHLITLAQNSHLFNFGHEGPGITNVCCLKILRSIAAAATTRAVVYLNSIATSFTLNMSGVLYNANGSGCLLRSSDTSPLLHVYDCMAWGGDYGLIFDATDLNVNSVFENSSFYNMAVAGVDLGGNAGTIRNIASIGNLANYANMGLATIIASPDGLVAATQWQSLVAADGDTFLLPIAGSDIDTLGVAPTYATTLINGAVWGAVGNEIGAKGRLPVPSTGITRQSHTAIHNGIAIM